MPRQGVFHPCPGNPVHPKARLAFVLHFFSFFPNARTSAAIDGSRTLHLARDVMQLLAYLVPRPSWTVPSGRDSPSCRIPTTRAAMTSPCALKANLALRGVPHASTCALPVRNLRRALCEQNTTRRPRRVPHTRPPGEPIHSESVYPAWLLSVAGSATFTAHVSGPGFTPVSEHVAVSGAARPEPRARHRANPA